MEISSAGCEENDLEEYSKLFAICFPKASHLRTDYLRWLYLENPAGRLVGFNAFIDGRLAAHYACIPASVRLGSGDRRALLSLNTATHPDFQGRGLFTRLAELSYGAALADGIDLVFGIANANSTQGFVRKLGFQLVAPLESRMGFGRLGEIDWQRAATESEFRRSWPESELRWRMSNPTNKVRAVHFRDGSIGLAARTGRFPFHAWAELPSEAAPVAESAARLLGGPRVFLGAFPKGTCQTRYVSLPDRFRPSPLNFIVRGLNAPLLLDKDRLLVSFLDFDAF
jgi:GNAT superfamily N-acetyltransferase